MEANGVAVGQLLPFLVPLAVTVDDEQFEPDEPRPDLGPRTGFDSSRLPSHWRAVEVRDPGQKSASSSSPAVPQARAETKRTISSIARYALTICPCLQAARRSSMSTARAARSRVAISIVL